VPQDGTVRTTGQGTWLRAALLGVLLLAATVLAVTLDLPEVAEVRTTVDAAGPVGWIAMVLGLTLLLLAPVPRSAVSVLVGVVAGLGPGFAVAFGAGLLAALAAFGVSRALGRSAATRLAGPRLARVDDLMVRRGFLAVLAGRLLPMVPFAVLSYGAGLTGIRWAPYAAGTAVGLVPSTLLQVGVGASAGALPDLGTPLLVLLLLGAALAVATAVWRRGRRAAA
jgi:uncharacterized membrane protein YdjX (TVP38/TMEM64 family)